jgi:CheY-like chemotaxis protein
MSPNDEILVVDDERAIVAFIAELLADEGFTIRAAYDGAEALEMIAAQPPALVLMDHAMPRMTGTDVLLQLRQSGSTVPIIIMSAEGQAGQFLAQGADAFLHKPFDLDTLLDCVAKHSAPPIEAALANEMPASAVLRSPELVWATPASLPQLLATSQRLRWDARWLSATSQRLQQRSQHLQQVSERLRRQSGRRFYWPS